MRRRWIKRVSIVIGMLVLALPVAYIFIYIVNEYACGMYIYLRSVALDGR